MPPDVIAYADRVGVNLNTHLFGYGYSDQRLTLENIAAKTRMQATHPELVRRIFGLMIMCAAANVDYGIGSTVRFHAEQETEFFRRHTTVNNGRSSRWYQGIKYFLLPGMAPYAPPGSSNHEEHTTPEGCIAADMIPPASLTFANQHAADFGLKHFTNVNSEPWHVQPAEWPNSRRAVDLLVTAGETLDHWPMPGTPQNEDDDMISLIRFWRPAGYQNIFAVTPWGSRHLGVETFYDLAAQPGMNQEVIDSDHAQEIAAVLNQSGLTYADLVPV